MREEAHPRRRTLDGSSHNGDISNHARRSTTDSNGHDASGGGARVPGGHPSRPAPAYRSERNVPSVAAVAAAPAAAANMVTSAASAAAAAAPEPEPARGPAPAYTVPSQRDARSVNPAVVNDYPYFHTEEWPFAAEQHDRQRENLLGGDDQVLIGRKEIPQLHALSSRPIEPGVGRLGGILAEWDKECALKHLDAIKPSVVSHEELHDFTLMEGEFAEDVLDLAGLENAPGLLHNITQRCRLTFTNQKRLVFTQTNHSAEVGVPTMYCLASVFHCFHDRWSTRKWSSFYAAINASEILQVFVQQTLTTSYMSTTHRWDEICNFVWCTVGGVMTSSKDLNGATQTLGDFDQGSCVRRWDKTRYMRHALVIRYLDCSTNSVMQTTAMAHPDTPASKLYEMARSIEANITIRSSDWLKCKTVPTPLVISPFTNELPSLPLFRQKSYRFLMFGLFFVAFVIVFLNPVAGLFMMLAVAIAIVGAYTSGAQRATLQPAGLAGMRISKTLLGTQSLAGMIYVPSFLGFFLGE